MKEVREFLKEINEKNGLPTDDKSLGDTLCEQGKIVYRYGDHDTHRWYIREEVVAELQGKFISYTDFIITGDASMDDMDLKYDLDNASFVISKERQVTERYFVVDE